MNLPFSGIEESLDDYVQSERIGLFIAVDSRGACRFARDLVVVADDAASGKTCPVPPDLDPS